MAGTIPLISQVPDKEPMTNKISIAPMAELMLLTILPSMVDHVVPARQATRPATKAESTNAIWFGPSVADAPNTTTFAPRRVIRTMIGTRASPREGLDFTCKIGWFDARAI